MARANFPPIISRPRSEAELQSQPPADFPGVRTWDVFSAPALLGSALYFDPDQRQYAQLSRKPAAEGSLVNIRNRWFRVHDAASARATHARFELEAA